MYRIGVDIGGTFTDLVLVSDGTVPRIYKEPSTPHDPAKAIVDGLRALATGEGLGLDELLGRTRLFVHGTTIATNTVIQRNGPPTGLICTEGFRDVLYFRDGFKDDRFNLRFAPPQPFVDRHLRIGVPERVDSAGQVVTQLDEGAVRAAAQRCRERGVRTVAVAFLWSMVNPAHEHRAAEIVREEIPGAFVVCSSDVLPEIREWQRTSAAVLSAYLLPGIDAYFQDLLRVLADEGLPAPPLIMQLNGGCASVREILQRPVYALHSGPAAAPAAATHHTARRGVSGNVITVDMGGTSFDVCVVNDGRPALSRDLTVDGQPVGVAGIAVHTVGAGGGSIASIDDGGALRVGPMSAGATPGPAAYGSGGTLPTVTDANVVLGYIQPETFLGGRRELRRDLAEQAMAEHVAGPLAVDLDEAAAGVVRVVNAHMVAAIRAVSVDQGLDPRRFTLVSGGGAGGLHTVSLARELGMERVVIPREAGTLCAFGMAVTNVRHDGMRAHFCNSSELSAAVIAEIHRDLESQARAQLTEEGFGPDQIAIGWMVDARYPGQAHELTVELPATASIDAGAIEAAFHAAHDRQFGYRRDGMPVEILHWRIAATGALPAATEPVVELSGATPQPSLVREMHIVGQGRCPVPIYDADAFPVGGSVRGPAVLASATTTILLERKEDVLTFDDPASFVVDIGVEPESSIAVLSESMEHA